MCLLADQIIEGDAIEFTAEFEAGLHACQELGFKLEALATPECQTEHVAKQHGSCSSNTYE